RRDRARNDPPVTEIFSAVALNELLADLQQVPLAGVKDLPVDGAVVRRGNFTTARNSSNIGLLRNAGRLSRPLILTGEAYQAPRERLNALAQGAVERLQSGGKVDSATILQMYDDLEAINQKLREVVGEVPASQFIEAKRFLNQLGDALKALERP